MMPVRRLVLVPFVAALAVGLLGLTPANASFADSTGTGTMKITTATVAAPGSVTGTLTCAKTSATMAATWTLSAAPRVSGYLVTVYFSDGYTQTVELDDPTATSWSAPIGIYNVTAYQVQYSVTTLTSYGWTNESARTGWFHC